MMRARCAQLIHAERLPAYRLRLRDADGVTGVVDLAHLVGKGVFELWTAVTALS